MSRVRILNAEFDALTLEESVDAAIMHVHEGRRGWLCTVNVAILMMMRDDPWLQSFVERATFIVADGQPLVWFAPMFDAHLPTRIAGVDMVFALARRCELESIEVGLVGAKRPVVDAVAERLQEHFPGLRIACVQDGYFGPEEAPARADAIRESGAKILFVGMGVPRQERFIEALWDRLGVNLAIGVGGSFDVLAGIRARAPKAVQKTGFEWAYRLAQEPGRLWRRYLTTNSRFLALVGRRAVVRTVSGKRSLKDGS